MQSKILKDKICFETGGSIKPDNCSQGFTASRSSFYDLEYFSLWDNFCVDTMRDFSEGICLYKLKNFSELLILKSIFH